LPALSPAAGAEAPAALKNAFPRAPVTVGLPESGLLGDEREVEGLLGAGLELELKGSSESSSFFGADGSPAFGSAGLAASADGAAGCPAVAPGGAGPGPIGDPEGGAMLGGPGGGGGDGAEPESFDPQPQIPTSKARPTTTTIVPLMELLRFL
jgi:hypothetical protein